MFTFQFSIEGLAAWLDSQFNDPKARFVALHQPPEPSTTSTMTKLKGLVIAVEGGYEVRLLDLNYLLDIRTSGLQKWLKACQALYTSYYIDGRRVIEFRREVDGFDVTVAYAVDNKSAPITVRVAEAPAAA